VSPKLEALEGEYDCVVLIKDQWLLVYLHLSTCYSKDVEAERGVDGVAEEGRMTEIKRQIQE
jgi:hypothetical protein